MAEIVRPMFTSLPMPKGLDADQLLGGYLVALEGLLPATLRSVVIQLVKGTWWEEVKFCPRPPELANMVREEQRRIDAVNRPRLAGPAVVPHQFVDVRVSQRLRAEGLARQGYVLVGSSVKHDDFTTLGKSRAIPAGSIHLWAIDEVWCPGAVADQADTGRIAMRRKAKDHTSANLSPEHAEMLEKIMDLPDAREITPDQAAYRRRVAAELNASTEQEAAE